MTEVDIQDGVDAKRLARDRLHAVTIASTWVVTAKRTRSPRLIECAELDLQAAVDRARDLGVQWGQVGVALGIARGNAYQRYRKRIPNNDYRDNSTSRVRIA